MHKVLQKSEKATKRQSDKVSEVKNIEVELNFVLNATTQSSRRDRKEKLFNLCAHCAFFASLR